MKHKFNAITQAIEEREYAEMHPHMPVSEFIERTYIERNVRDFLMSLSKPKETRPSLVGRFPEIPKSTTIVFHRWQEENTTDITPAIPALLALASETTYEQLSATGGVVISIINRTALDIVNEFIHKMQPDFRGPVIGVCTLQYSPEITPTTSRSGIWQKNVDDTFTLFRSPDGPITPQLIRDNLPGWVRESEFLNRNEKVITDPPTPIQWNTIDITAPIRANPFDTYTIGCVLLG